MDGYESPKEKREVPLQMLCQIVQIIDGNGKITCYAIVKIDGKTLLAPGARKRNLKNKFPESPEDYLQISVLSIERIIEILKAVKKINPETENVDFTKFSPGDSIMVPQKIYELLSYGYSPTIYFNKVSKHFFVPNTNNFTDVKSIIAACEIICTAVRHQMLPIVFPQRDEQYVFDSSNMQYIVYSLSENKVRNVLRLPETLLPINNPVHDKTLKSN